jgi:uncharacterized oxidoreductase
MNISGKRALVTGGSSGIGFEIARQLLERGAWVVITGRRKQTLDHAVRELTASGEVVGVPADVTTAVGRDRLLHAALQALGGLDMLVNNAGGVRAGSLQRLSEVEIRWMIEVNLTAPILLTRASLPALERSGDAVIVNISSGIGLIGVPFYTPYAAAKAGIAHFGEALRREVGEGGIRVLTVYPTATETPMMATSGMSPVGGRDTPEAVARESIEAIIDGRLEVIRGGADRMEMVKRNRIDPIAIDDFLRPMRAYMEEASRNHSAL